MSVNGGQFAVGVGMYGDPPTISTEEIPPKQRFKKPFKYRLRDRAHRMADRTETFLRVAWTVAAVLLAVTVLAGFVRMALFWPHPHPFETIRVIARRRLR